MHFCFTSNVQNHRWNSLNGILEAVICWEDTLQHPPGLNANRKPCTWFWTSSSGKLGSPASSLLRHWFHNTKTPSQNQRWWHLDVGVWLFFYFFFFIIIIIRLLFFFFFSSSTSFSSSSSSDSSSASSLFSSSSTSSSSSLSSSSLSGDDFQHLILRSHYCIEQTSRTIHQEDMTHKIQEQNPSREGGHVCNSLQKDCLIMPETDTFIDADVRGMRPWPKVFNCSLAGYLTEFYDWRMIRMFRHVTPICNEDRPCTDVHIFQYAIHKI